MARSIGPTTVDCRPVTGPGETGPGETGPGEAGPDAAGPDAAGPDVTVVLLSDRPELTEPVRELVCEFLLLPDSWVHRVSPGGALPEFLVEEIALLPVEPAPPAGAVAVALKRGEPVGTAQVRRIDDRTCELKRMYVRPAHQREGVGRQLVDALVEVAIGLGYEKMYLDTTRNRPSAMRFYENLGFRPTRSRNDWGPESLAYLRDLSR